MTYKIIGDSCLDLTDEMKEDPHFELVPLTLEVGEDRVRDDHTFDQKGFLNLVKACPSCPRTACPSPQAYQQAIAEADAPMVFLVTLSEHLSGSYNAAVLGKRMFEEEQHLHPEQAGRQVAVIDSLSASSGELNLALYIQQLCRMGLDFEQIRARALAYRDQMKTYFVLENLDTLRKNGRLKGLQAFIATALNIKPVMGADRGTIIKLDQARGIKRALERMCGIAVSETCQKVGKIAVIAHCNNPDRAEYVKGELAGQGQFDQIVVTETAGVSTVYAGDGGIVLAI